MKREELEKKLISKYGFVISKKILSLVLGVSVATINRLISTATIPYFKVSNRPNSAVRFEVSDVLDYIEKQRIIAFEGEV